MKFLACLVYPLPVIGVDDEDQALGACASTIISPLLLTRMAAHGRKPSSYPKSSVSKEV